MKRIITSLLCGLVLLPAVSSDAADANALEQALSQLPGLAYGQDSSGLEAIAEAARASAQDASLHQKLESRLVEIVGGTATDAAKDYACRILKMIATDKSVAALAALLESPALASIARSALESLPGPAVDRALRDSLPRLRGELKAGVISSIGQRRDLEAVSSLTLAASDSNPTVARAAILALGKIASSDSLRALSELGSKAAESLRPMIQAAQLDAADRLLRQGQASQAAAVFRQLSSPAYVKLASFQGEAAASGVAAMDVLYRGLKAFHESPEGEMTARLAGRLIGEWTWMPIPPQAMRQLGGTELSPESKVLLLDALAARRDPAARESVLATLTSPESSVRVAALNSLAAVGSAEDVPLLAEKTSAGPESERQAARRSLVALSAPGVEERMVAALSRGEPGSRSALLRALASRNATNAAASVMPFITDPDRRVSQAAVEAVGVLGGLPQVSPLVQGIVTATSASQRTVTAEALMAVCVRLREQAAPAVLRGLDQAKDAPTRAVLVELLGNVGGEDALQKVRAASRDSDPQIREAGIRALADWPDPSAAQDLLQLVRQSPPGSLRVIAFRGCVRMAREAEAPPEVKYKVLEETMAAANTTEEKILVLSGVGDVRRVEALTLATRYLDDPALVDEAAAAVVKIAPLLEEKDRQEVNKALQRVMDTAKTQSIKDDARRQLQGFGR